jgi:hypothetical protein
VELNYRTRCRRKKSTACAAREIPKLQIKSLKDPSIDAKTLGDKPRAETGEEHATAGTDRRHIKQTTNNPRIARIGSGRMYYDVLPYNAY